MRGVGSIEERLIAYVDSSGDCWVWTAATDRDGYGVTTMEPYTSVRAHRAAWALENGPIPDGLEVCHSCDNPPCVRVSHLFLGTREDNAKDCVSKGRNWQQRKTHCVHGHEYTEENTYRQRGGGRSCRTCRALSNKRRFQTDPQDRKDEAS